MHTTVVQILGKRECPYTFNGVNLAEMRRAELYRLARAFDLGGPQQSKNELLTLLISKLKLMNSEQEITDMVTTDG